ncbi:restriction endonuclease [Streptoalloteichus hindustanus]|uniref:Restriction endonuclease n=1 Tax=Streptoalloteichus hindustanus TaxID=2017 RepID=A0A1M5JCL1_STRHI|nr:restriction endonuclease [Streptoalloteichus hindustanus]SHG38292.1 Restriction endonuclease [Streptoalloteichus hindustanus]
MSADPEAARTGRRRSWAERQALADRLTARVAAREAELAGLLRAAMRHPAGVGLDLLLHPGELHPFAPGALAGPTPPSDHAEPHDHGLLRRLTRRRTPAHPAEHEQARAQADQIAAEHQRQLALAAARRAHSERTRVLRDQLREQHAGLRGLAARVAAGEPDAVRNYFARLLRCSSWPVGIPSAAVAMRYQPAARRLVVSWPLPPPEVIPPVAAFRPDRGRRGVAAVPRPEADLRTRYAELLAAVVLRVVRELFLADHDGVLASVAVNGELTRRDAMTGRDGRVHLASVATEQADFERSIVVGDPVRWLRALGGVVSPDPAEPVRPLVDLPPHAEPPQGGGPATDVSQLSPEGFAQLARRLWVAAGLRGWTSCGADPVQVTATGELPTDTGWERCLVAVRRDRGPTPTHALEPVRTTMGEHALDHAVLATTTWFPLALHRDAAHDPRLRLLEGDALRDIALRHLGVALTGLSTN